MIKWWKYVNAECMWCWGWFYANHWSKSADSEFQVPADPLQSRSPSPSDRDNLEFFQIRQNLMDLMAWLNYEWNVKWRSRGEWDDFLFFLVQNENIIDRDRTRTCNPQIRSLVPYSLGHTTLLHSLQILLGVIKWNQDWNKSGTDSTQFRGS